MASYTTNLNLKKPAGSENVAIGDINNNMDTIDQAFGTLNGKFTIQNSRIYGGVKTNDSVPLRFTAPAPMVGLIYGSWQNIQSYDVQPGVVSVNTGATAFTVPTLRDFANNIISTEKDLFVVWIICDDIGIW